MINFKNLQYETIEKVTGLLKSYEEVDGIFITGSHAKGEESSFSDIDIGFIFSSPQRPKREEIFNKVMNIFPSICALWLYDKQGLFLYNNGVRLDLDFLTLDDLEEWDLSDVKLVYDPQGKYQTKNQYVSTSSKPAPKPKWRDDDGDMIEWFLWMFRQSYCYIRRGETNEIRSFNKLYSAQTSLSSVREKLIEMRIYLNGEWEYMSLIDKDFGDKMGKSFSDFAPDNMAIATRELFDLFEVTAKDYCKKVDKAFPTDKVNSMRVLFDEFDGAKN